MLDYKKDNFIDEEVESVEEPIELDKIEIEESDELEPVVLPNEESIESLEDKEINYDDIPEDEELIEYGITSDESDV